MSTKPANTWSLVKAKLAKHDARQLLSLIQELYAAYPENRAFLHARFTAGDDVLEPYKTAIDRWLWPDIFRKQQPSFAKAKQAITDYKKAVGNPAGLAELMVFACERAAGFYQDVGGGERDVTAVLWLFEQGASLASKLPASLRDEYCARLTNVREISFGYGVEDLLDEALRLFRR